MPHARVIFPFLLLPPPPPLLLLLLLRDKDCDSGVSAYFAGGTLRFNMYVNVHVLLQQALHNGLGRQHRLQMKHNCDILGMSFSKYNTVAEDNFYI